jgi:hypothetical protein
MQPHNGDLAQCRIVSPVDLGGEGVRGCRTMRRWTWRTAGWSSRLGSVRKSVVSPHVGWFDLPVCGWAGW